MLTLSYILLLPFLVFLAFVFPGAADLRDYIVPSTMNMRSYPKERMRAIGIAYLLWALWIGAVMARWKTDGTIDWSIGVVFFILPFLGMMAAVIGLWTLFSSIFGKEKTARPLIERTNVAYADELPRYIRGIKIWLGINALSLLGIIGYLLGQPDQESLWELMSMVYLLKKYG